MSFAVPVFYGMATADTVRVINMGSEHPHSLIVVDRGCRSEFFKQDSVIDKNLPQDSLLSLVYGNVPSPDSADISGSSAQKEQGKRYKEKAEQYKDRYKISVAPAINLREPGGGLLVQLGF